MSQYEPTHDFVATPTMAAFMASDAYVRVLAGPIGSGKSVCCTHTLVQWAAMQKPNSKGVRRTRFLIVRNTADQLKSTTMKTVFEWFPPGLWGDYKVTDNKTFTVRFRLPDDTVVNSEWMFMPLDTPDDVRKALSLEITGLWGNEARELHPEVVDGLISRCDRFPPPREGGATRPGAIFDTNMPSVDSWWFKQMTEPPENWSVHIQPPAVITLQEYLDKYKEDPPEERTAKAADGTIFTGNPDADNYKNLSPRYYKNNIIGKTRDFIDVYLLCKYGRTLNGVPVFDKAFRRDFHVAEKPLIPIRSSSYPIVVGMDFGRTPAAVFGQMDPRGRVLVYSEVTAENMGIEKFLRTVLRPHIMERYLGFPIVVAPDPAGWQKSQVNELSPVDILKAEGFRAVRPATNAVEPRIMAVERLLLRQSDGGPAFIVSSDVKTVIRAFEHGYRWKTDSKGGIIDNSPVKNEYSHVMDALQYFALVVEDAGHGYALDQRREVKPAPVRIV